jgi:hypothetical protein
MHWKFTRTSALTALPILLSLASCGSPSERPQTLATIPSGLTVELMYEVMEQAIVDGSGEVLHASIVTEDFRFDAETPIPVPTPPPDYDPEAYADQVWLDADTGIARFETRRTEEEGGPILVSRSIVTSDRTVAVDHRGNSDEPASRQCQSTDSALLATLLRCALSGWNPSTSVQAGEYKQRPTIVLVTTGEFRSDGDPVRFEQRIHVDPESYLPVGVEEISRRNEGEPTRFEVRIVQRYDIEFLDRDALPDDFFDPSSIDYVEPGATPADTLQSEVNGTRVYWLGAEVDVGVAGPLVLDESRLYPGEQSPGHVAGLSYNVEELDPQYRGISVRTFAADAADRVDAEVQRDWTRDDVTQEPLSVPGGTGVLYRMATQHGDLYRAHLFFETSIVVIYDYFGPPPYTGREAFMRVVAALRPYEP